MSGRDLAGRAAIVTGGSSGIGLAIARELTTHGARVMNLDLNPPPTDEAGWYPTDVSDRASVNRSVELAVARLGGLDILVNNAGIGAQGDAAANNDDEWARVLSVNVTSIARTAHAAVPHLRRSETASICNLGSIAATVGLPSRALYSASKGAVLSLTRAMAADYLPFGIRVNAVNPGTADTPWVQRLLGAAEDPVQERRQLEARQPHGRLVSAAEVASAVLHLVGSSSGSTTGSYLEVDGGMAALRLRQPG